MRKIWSAAVVVVGALVMASCSTTVAGTPMADPSALPKPDVGSYPTTARTLGAPSAEEAAMQEGLRMAGTMPLLSDIEPALHFGGDLTAGTMQSGTRSIALTYGESAGKALAATEAGVTASARADSLGAKAEPGKPSRSAVVGVLRLPTPEAAAAAVSPGLLAGEEAVFGVKSPAKVPSAIPGYPAAVAYTQAWTATTSFVAFLAHRQFVIAVYSNWSPDQVKSYFDRQIKGLEGFVPTAADKFSTLPLDASGVAKLTLPSGGKFNGYSADANIVVRNQTDVTRSVKTFADAGVDVVAFRWELDLSRA